MSADDWGQTLNRPKGMGAPAVLVLRLPDDWMVDDNLQWAMHEFGSAMGGLFPGAMMYVAIKDKAEDILAVLGAD
jgi:hypothetical protein